MSTSSPADTAILIAPGGEYLMALETRFFTIRSSASGSTSAAGTPGAQSTTKR